MSMLDKEPGLAPRRGMVRRLSPEVTELRDKIIARFDGKPLDEIADFVQKVLASEQNETRRIAALAARVVLIRNHINNLAGIEPAVKSKKKKKKDSPTDEMDPNLIVAHGGMDTKVRPGMKRVRITENAEVYGFQFPAGVIVDVKEEDAQRLLDAGKAELSGKDITGSDVSDAEVTAVETRDDETDMDGAEADNNAEAEAEVTSREDADEQDPVADEVADEDMSEDVITEDVEAEDIEAEDIEAEDIESEDEADADEDTDETEQES